MAGPGGKVIGKVSIRVVPDTSGFAPDLAADLATIERGLSVDIPVGVDTRQLAEDLGRLRTQIDTATRGVEVRVGADVSRAVAAVETLAASAPTVEVPVDVNLAKATAELAAVERLAAGLNPTVRVGVAVDPTLRTRLGGLRSALAGGSGALDPTLRARMETLRARLTDAGAVELQVDIDVAAALAKVEATKRAIEAVEGPRIDIGAAVNRDALQASLEDARQRVDEIVKKTRSVRLGNDFGPDSAVQIPAALTLDRGEIQQDLADLRLRLINEFGGGLPVPFSFDRDVEGSLTDLRLRVEQLVAGAPFQVPATFATPLNENRLFGDLAILSRRLAANGGEYEWGIKLTAEQDQLQRSLAEMQQRIRGLLARQQVQPLTVRIGPDDKFVTDLRRRISEAVSSVDASIPLTARGDAFRARVQAAVREAEASLQVDVPMDIAQAGLWRKKALAAVEQVQALVDRQVESVKVDVDVDVDRGGVAQQRLQALRAAVADTARAFDRLLKITQIRDALTRFGTQLALILARAAAYAALLGPPLILASSGALALAPAFATAIPFVAGLAAQIGVVALGLDGLFGAKQAGGGRLGGPFQNLREQIGEVRGEIGSLLASGLQPLSEAFQATSFTAFTDGMKGIAAATNLAITNFLLFTTSTQAVTGTEQVFAALTRQATVFAQLVEPLARTLLNVSVAAIPGFDRLNEALLNGGLRFAAFIERVSASGQLTNVINRAVDDFIAFVSGLGRITGRIIEVLAALEPAARAAFGGLGSAIETGLTRLTNFLNNAQLSGSPLEGLVLGIRDVFLALRGIPTDILTAFAPLVQSSAFADFLSSLGAALVVAAQAVGVLSAALSSVVAATTQLVVVPVLPFFTSLVGGMAGAVSLLSQHQALFTTLAIILATRYVPALATATAAARTFVTVNIVGALSSAASSIGAFVARIPVLIAGVQAFGVAALGVGASVRAMGAAFLAAAAPIAAIVVPLFAVVSAATAFSTAGAEVKAGADQIVQATDATTLRGALAGMNELSDRMRALQAEDAQFQAQPAVKRWADQFGQAFQQMFGGKNDILERAKGIEATADAISVIADKARNARANIAAVSSAAGITSDTVAEVAKSLGVDLTKGFDESANARQQVVAFMQKVSSETGISAEALSQFAKTSETSFQQVSKEAQAAAKKVSDAFTRDTDVLGTLDLTKAQGALSKALDARAKAQQRVSDVEERLASKKKITISDTQMLERAQRALADANQKVAASRGGVGVEAIRNAYSEAIALAESFTQNIARAYQAGLDPTVIARLLEAGPKQATPILEAILSDHSGRMVDLVNESETKLAALNQQVLAQQRIMWIAIQSEAAAGSDKYLLQVNDAMRISAELFASGGTASVNAIAEKLKLSPSRVADIAKNFGFSQILDQLQNQADRNPIQVRFRLPATLPTPGGGSRPNPVANKPLPGGIPGLRAGGLVHGPGTKTSDSILRMLSRGEFVQQAAAVDHYGLGVMRAINERRIPKDILSGAAVKQLAGATKAVHAAAADVRSLAASIPRRPRAAPAERVIGIDAARSGALPAAYPRSLAVVDADGVLRGQMKVAAATDHKARMHSDRRRRLGPGGGS